MYVKYRLNRHWDRGQERLRGGEGGGAHLLSSRYPLSLAEEKKTVLHHHGIYYS